MMANLPILGITVLEMLNNTGLPKKIVCKYPEKGVECKSVQYPNPAFCFKELFKPSVYLKFLGSSENLPCLIK